MKSNESILEFKVTKFYVAASYARKEEASRIEKTILAEVRGMDSRSHWLKQKKNGYTIYDKRKAHKFLGEKAKVDLGGVCDSDVFIILTGDRLSLGGKWTEMGIAIACGLKIFILGPREGVFCHLPSIVQCDSLVDLIKELKT